MNEKKSINQCNNEFSRYVASVSYKGTLYHGWQRLKNNLKTVQEVVEEALSKIANHSVSIVCAGRTDAGVHASHQIVHFDSNARRSEINWLLGVNRYLPDDIVVSWIKPISFDFHARFSAIARRYIYIIYNHVTRSAFLSNEITWYRQPLNIIKMQQAGNYLTGEHDFNAYRTVKCQAKHAVRKITHLQVRRISRFVILDIQANAFLHHMVRNITGVLIKIGKGEQKSEWAQEVLLSKDRRCADITAPPCGLYLADVIYPENIILPEEPKGPPFISKYFTSSSLE